MKMLKINGENETVMIALESVRYFTVGHVSVLDSPGIGGEIKVVMQPVKSIQSEYVGEQFVFDYQEVKVWGFATFDLAKDAVTVVDV
jgi:hypothetical protein